MNNFIIFKDFALYSGAIIFFVTVRGRQSFTAAAIPWEMQKPNHSVLIEHDKEIEQAAFALKAMSHPLRLKIMCVLGAGEMSVQDIVEQVGTTQSNISQHLAILREKAVLCTRKEANRVYYRIADSRTLRLMSLIREVFCGDN